MNDSSFGTHVPDKGRTRHDSRELKVAKSFRFLATLIGGDSMAGDST
jgi:hypothetical protein